MRKGIAYLIKVDTENNRNFYYQMKQVGDVFQVEYGRVGANPIISKRPMEFWDETYNKKINEGFIDRTDMISVKEEHQKVYKEISEKSVADMVSFLLKAAKKTIEEQYTVSVDGVSQKMIDDAQDLIYQMSLHDKDLSFVCRQLSKLFVVIPRKMKDVAKELPEKIDDIPAIIRREQDLLDVMRSQVSENSKTSEGKHTILEANNLEITEVLDEKEISQIKKYLTSESVHLFIRAFRVRNQNTDNRFYTYLKENKMSNKDIHYFYHGSKNMNYWGLITEGQSLNPKAPITGKMFGYGLYYAPRAKKSINYTSLSGSYWAKGSSDKAYLAVFKVAYKNAKHVDTWDSSMTTYRKSSIKPYDAVHAHAGVSLLNDEVIVYDEAQVAIQYLIELG